MAATASDSRPNHGATHMLIRNTTARIYGTKLGGDVIALKPGVNDVAPATWAELKKIAVISHSIAEGHLVEVDAPEAKAPAVETLKNFKPDEAIRLVKTTVDRELLERWIDTENRKRVLDALEAQLDAVAVKDSKPDDPDDNADGDDDEG